MHKNKNMPICMYVVCVQKKSEMCVCVEKNRNMQKYANKNNLDFWLQIKLGLIFWGLGF